MKIVWIKKKLFDIAPDRTTWLEMIKNLQNLGHEIELITGYKKDKPPYNLNSTIKYIPSINTNLFIYHVTFNIELYFRILSYILRKNPDVVIFDCYTFINAFPLDVFSKLGMLKTKFTMDVRSYIYKEDVTSIKNSVKKLLSYCSFIYSKYLFDAITVITPLLKKQIVDQFGFDEAKIDIWTSGVDIDFFKRRSVVKSLEAQFEKRFVVMYHGSLSFNRGLLEAIQAIHLLKKDLPDILFFILGNGVAKDEILFLIGKYDLKDQIILKESVEYNLVPQYINVSDIGIMPYPEINFWQTSSPLKLIEYLAMQKCVIVRDLVAFREVIGSAKCAFFLRSNDPASIAKAIKKTYKMRNKLSEMGKIGRTIVKSNYTWKSQAQHLDSFLIKLIKGS